MASCFVGAVRPSEERPFFLLIPSFSLPHSNIFLVMQCLSPKVAARETGRPLDFPQMNFPSRSNCRIPCHWKVAPLKIVATWPQSWRVTQGEDAKSVHGYVATWLSGYAATKVHSYVATELLDYVGTELWSYKATELRSYGSWIKERDIFM